jgi:acyl carrier protein
VDRQKLPKPDRDRPELETNFVAPQTPTEQELAQIWLEVLGIERVGVHDNFFELGGHSLLVTQIISRVRTQFGTEIAVRDLFTASTIAQLAKQIDELLLARLDSNDVDDMLTLLDDLDDAEAERLLGQLDMTT